MVYFPCLLQTGSIKQCVVHDVKHVPKLVIRQPMKVCKPMEGVEVGEAVPADLLHNLLQLVQLLDPDVEELIALVCEEDASGSSILARV